MTKNKPDVTYTKKQTFGKSEYINAKKAFAGYGNSEADAIIFNLLDFCTGYEKTQSLRLLYTLIKSGSETDKINFPDLGAEKFTENIEKLSRGYPLQYITGRANFYGYEFIVGEGVLIPRYDTETVAEKAIGFLSDGMKVLDLCCGSGCIGLTILKEAALKNFNIEMTLADFSEKALYYTKKNAEQLELESRAKIIMHDIKKDSLSGKFDLIVSNPPYITENELNALDENVKNEPLQALAGGIDGLDFYRIITEKNKNNLNNGGILLFECGKGQFSDIINIMEEKGYRNTGFACDLGGVERAVWGANPCQ